MLDASATGGENIEGAISILTRYFRAQKLSVLCLHMTRWGTPYWDRVRPLSWSRCMSDGLVLTILCSSEGKSNLIRIKQRIKFLIFFPWIITNLTRISDSIVTSKCRIWKLELRSQQIL
jgi:hypothetical protein